jgi:hypothetical protein
LRINKSFLEDATRLGNLHFALKPLVANGISAAARPVLRQSRTVSGAWLRLRRRGKRVLDVKRGRASGIVPI